MNIPDINIKVSRCEKWQAITLVGRFTVRTVSAVRGCFDRAEKKPLPGIVINMSEVVQLDSSAITLLINFQNRIVEKKGRLVLIGLTRDIAEIFSIAGIDALFQICKDYNEFRSVYCG